MVRCFINLAKKRKMQKKIKSGQISVEYLIVIGFITFVVISTLGIALFYSGSIKDRIKATQINNYANKLTSTAESVFYAGYPSKATVTCYLPDNAKDIEVLTNELVITFQTSSGTNKISFASNVPMLENATAQLTTSQGLKKIQVEAQQTQVLISQV